ncbi:MAG TPA: hypothetical protein VEZ88_09125 [Steroidobacteraceae bacterium]|nr:hypothetical protein [Steroidobacteraceae bacterium]
MNTHTIRKLAFTTVLATAALMASASQASEECVRETGAYASEENYVAVLGHMYVTASRATRVADLGALVVTARRNADSRVASLGAMTVSAKRETGAMVADLGSLTVSARRDGTLLAELGSMTVTAVSMGAVTVAAHTADHSWD